MQYLTLLQCYRIQSIFLGGSSSISAHYLPPVNIENIDIPYLLACVEIHQLIAVLKNIVDTASSLQWTVVIFALIWAVTDGGAEAAPCRDLITFSFHSCRPQHHSNHSHCMCPLCPLFCYSRLFCLIKIHDTVGTLPVPVCAAAGTSHKLWRFMFVFSVN